MAPPALPSDTLMVSTPLSSSVQLTLSAPPALAVAPHVPLLAAEVGKTKKTAKPIAITNILSIAANTVFFVRIIVFLLVH